MLRLLLCFGHTLKQFDAYGCCGAIFAFPEKKNFFYFFKYFLYNNFCIYSKDTKNSSANIELHLIRRHTHKIIIILIMIILNDVQCGAMHA